jgi:hypothetical protein
MARLIRMDNTGHTTLAEWTPADAASVESAVAALRAELDKGYAAARRRARDPPPPVRRRIKRT